MELFANSELPSRRRQLPTRKSRREKFYRRTGGRPECTSTRIILFALLALIALTSTELNISSSFVASAFTQPWNGISRIKNPKTFGFLGVTLPLQSISETKDDAQDRQLQRSESRVEVWDGVFTPEVCQDLHELAIDHSERTTGEEEEEFDDDSLDGSSIFVHRGRNRSENDQLTPIEQALDSFLTAYYDREGMSDDNPNREVVVEYWCRQEHLNLEAHADVDEVSFERSCKTSNHPNFRYPSVGHVLYLTKPTLGLGPTCVFPPKATNQGYDTDSNIKDEIESVVTIPAVPGRILRFAGNALHGVPKPADVWFSHDDGVGTFVDDDDMDAQWNEDDDEFDDDFDDDDEERSVILFNTWERNKDETASDIPVGPIGVPLDPMFHVNSDVGIVDMMMSSVDMEGVEVDEEFVKGMVAYAKQQKKQQLQDWYENYSVPDTERNPTASKSENHRPVIYSKVHCQPSEMWEVVQIDKSQSHSEGNSMGSNGTLSVPLMGDEMRRRYSKKVVRWTIPSAFEKGVKESEKPYEFPVAE